MITVRQWRVRILEILDTIQGEGTLAGTPCTLVRLAGCPLRCRYCDALDALSPRAGTPWSIPALIAEVERRDRPLVLITGGEPLAQRATIPLLRALVQTGRTVQMETSGAYPIDAVPEGVRIVLDIKTPDSGEEERNRWDNLARLRAGDEIKFVICSHADFIWMLGVIRKHDLAARGLPILVSPAWGWVSPGALAEWVLAARAPVRVQVQLHKILWPEGEEDRA